MDTDAVAKATETLPEGWVMTTVGRAGAVRLGRQRSPRHLTGQHNTKYLRSANITAAGELDLGNVLEMDFTPEERAIYALRSGDILLVDSSGSASQVGRAAIWNEEISGCCYQNHLVRFRSHAVLPQYALVVFRHFGQSDAFSAVARGIGIQHLGSSRFAEMPFPIPPIAEQGRIVDEVDRRLIELEAAKRALESTLSHAIEQDRLILDAAVSGTLVESEATRSAREGRSFESATRLLSRLRPDEGSSLFPIVEDVPPSAGAPPGWALPSIAEVGEVRLGRQRAPRFERGEHQTPYLRAANVTAGGIDLSDVFHMEFSPADRRVYELQPGDVILTEGSGSSAHVGRSALWNGEIPGCCFQNTIIRFRPRAVSPRYALLAFRHMAENGVFGRAARGVGIQHLGASRFSRLAFPLPPAAEQDRIVAEAEERLRASRIQREAAQASLARFDEIRRELWATAVAGHLVPQRAGEESAELLLARLGPPVETSFPAVRPTLRESVVAKPSTRGGRKEHRRRLPAVLAKANRPLSIPELFAASGYDRDSASDVEQFYIELRKDCGQKIQKIDDAPENALVELIDAS